MRCSPATAAPATRCGRSTASASSRTSSRSASRWATAIPSPPSSPAARSSTSSSAAPSLFSTFGGNPVSAAAALAVLDVIEDERVLERVQCTGRALRDALVEIDHPEIADVRGVGLVWGVEFVDRRARPRGPRRDAPARRPGRNHRPARQRPQDPPAAGAERDPRPAARRNAAAGARINLKGQTL